MKTPSLAQVIRNSIDAERAAERFYRLLAESTKDADAQKFLTEMAENEAEHAARIQALGVELSTGMLPKYSDQGVESVESSPEWAFVDGIVYEEALMVALQNEEHAVLFYSAAADGTEGAVSKLFSRLAEDEDNHVRRLKSRLPNRTE